MFALAIPVNLDWIVVSPSCVKFNVKINEYDDSELGPIYGWSFRHFGGDYKKRHIAGIPNEEDRKIMNLCD